MPRPAEVSAPSLSVADVPVVGTRPSVALSPPRRRRRLLSAPPPLSRSPRRASGDPRVDPCPAHPQAGRHCSVHHGGPDASVDCPHPLGIHAAAARRPPLPNRSVATADLAAAASASTLTRETTRSRALTVWREEHTADGGGGSGGEAGRPATRAATRAQRRQRQGHEGRRGRPAGDAGGDAGAKVAKAGGWRAPPFLPAPPPPPPLHGRCRRRPARRRPPSRSDDDACGDGGGEVALRKRARVALRTTVSAPLPTAHRRRAPQELGRLFDQVPGGPLPEAARVGRQDSSTSSSATRRDATPVPFSPGDVWPANY